MTVPQPEEILSVTTDGVSDFIQHHASTKTLSRIVRSLNRDLLDGDPRASEMAARALRHLGFCEHS